MALGSSPHCSSRQNLLPANIHNYNLVAISSGAFSVSNNSLLPFSCVFTLETAFSAIIPAPSAFVSRYINKNVLKATKIALKLFIQGQKLVQT